MAFVPAVRASAVPVIPSPYPQPAIIHVEIEKPSGSLGIVFAWKGGPNDPVIITEIKKDSPLLETHLRAGQAIVAINGMKVLSSKHAISIIKDAPSVLRFTTHELVKASYLKVAFAFSYRHRQHPGFHVCSCREGTLVRVARIFPSGPFGRGATCLEVDDVILAVNGIPIKSPIEVDQAIRQSSLPSFIYIYALDMKVFRQALMEQAVESNKLVFRSVTLEKDSDSRSYTITQVKVMDGGARKNRREIARVTFNVETQRMEDPQEYLRLAMRSESGSTADYETTNVYFKGRYGTIARPLMREFNHMLEIYLRMLEEFVCVEAWKNPLGGCEDYPMFSNVVPVRASSERNIDDYPIAEILHHIHD